MNNPDGESGAKPARQRLSDELEAKAAAIVDSAYRVHCTVGPGLLESAYEACLLHELLKHGLGVERQVSLPVMYDGVRIDAGMRIDLVVDGCVVIELKSVETILPIHRAQVLTYLRLGGFRLGFLVNFNVIRIKDGIERFIL